jgi:hypothetical protein
MMMCKEGGRWNQAPNKKSAEWWCGGATTNETQKRVRSEQASATAFALFREVKL